jgi:hypothetical protein
MSRFSLPQVLILASVPMLLFAIPMRAESILFDNKENFLAASTGVTTLDFGTVVPPGQFQFFPTPPGLTLSGVNFTIDHPTSNGNLFVLGQGVYYSDVAVLSSQESTTGNNNLFITLPADYTAVGTGFASFGPSTLTFTLSTGDTFTRQTLDFFRGFASFVGVVSSEPITSVRIDLQRSDDLINIGAFSFGQATVPEPSTIILFPVGLLGIFAYSWRRRLQATRGRERRHDSMKPQMPRPIE